MHNADIYIYNLSESYVEKGVLQWQSYKIKFSNALLVAKAMTENQALVTRNIEDFKDSTNLNIFHPRQIS